MCLTDTIVTGVRALDIKNDNVSYTAEPGDIVSDVSVVANGNGEVKSEVKIPSGEIKGEVKSEENGS